MNAGQVRKLNKKAVCLIALLLLIPFCVFISFFFSEKKQTPVLNRVERKTYSNDNFAMAQLDSFPDSYAELKGFNKELEKEGAPDPSNSMAKALNDLETIADSNTTEQSNNLNRFSFEGSNEESPWKIAAREEERRRAFEHYEARRSDIMFPRQRFSHPINEVRQGQGKENSLWHQAATAYEMNQRPQSNTSAINDFNEGIVGKLQNHQPFTVSEGTVISAVLLSEINTDLTGPILAKVSQNIWDSQTGKFLLIPQNSKLIGEYSSRVDTGQTRAQIIWKRLIFPNQQSMQLSGMPGIDQAGAAGALGKVDNHYDKILLGIVMSTAIGAGVRLSQGKYDPNTASVSQEFGNAFAQDAARFGTKVADKMLAIKPTIKVAMGETVNVLVSQDLILRPYQG